MYGFMMEIYIGKWKYLSLLILSGFTSNLLSAVAYPYYVSVGSAGLIFAILTIFLSFIYENY
jgi:membrane associated rhomboid family serine protease